MDKMLAYCFGKSRTDSEESLTADIETDPVYLNNNMGHIQEGVSFIIYGVLNTCTNKFTIDFGLDNANNDLALRIIGSTEKNILSRNSRIKNKWGCDELRTNYPFHFEAGSYFEMQILLTVPEFMIAVNGFHVCKFTHRLPFHNIKKLEIHGCISDVAVERKIVTEYPQRPDSSPHFDRLTEDAEVTECEQVDEEPYPETPELICEPEGFMPMPYYAIFDRGFFDSGFSVAVKGRIKANPQTITINLQSGINVWPSPTVALQLQIRFAKGKDGETGEPTIARNSFTGGKWTGELVSQVGTGLRPNADFLLSVLRGKKTFEIYVNDKPAFEYEYKVNPKYVDTVFVSGDMLLFDIEIESV
ncbi:galectin-4-like [Glossina fuscipes]|uniref:Galectin n=1 Tax=Glossina fuscipes TaxID=7396 RepID=A0A8U0WM06_9MUSC|nr:galectin-4-like [Glossina fuscipes]